jgi:hypothetical protein
VVEEGGVVEGELAGAEARRQLAAELVALAGVAEERRQPGAFGVGLVGRLDELAANLREDVDRDAALEAMVAAEGRQELALEVVDRGVEERGGRGFARRHVRRPFR